MKPVKYIMLDLAENLFVFLVTTFLVVALFGAFSVIFVYVPVTLYTEAECLRNGYPKARVSVGLERYCINLDGTVTVNVVRLP